MAAKEKHWEAKAFSNAHGQLHRDLNVPVGKTIPVALLRKAARKGGKTGRRARAVLNADHGGG